MGRLYAEAKKSGKDLDALVTEAVEARLAVSRLSLRDVRAPVTEAIMASGMSPEEAEAFFEHEVASMRRERKTPSANQ